MQRHTDPERIESALSQAPSKDDLAEGKRVLRDALFQAYLKDLTDGSWRVRRKAARGLGELGKDAVVAVPLLEGLLKDRDFRVREAASLALIAIRGKG
jgi:HEAT repeat protein